MAHFPKIFEEPVLSCLRNIKRLAVSWYYLDRVFPRDKNPSILHNFKDLQVVASWLTCRVPDVRESQVYPMLQRARHHVKRYRHEFGVEDKGPEFIALTQ